MLNIFSVPTRTFLPLIISSCPVKGTILSCFLLAQIRLYPVLCCLSHICVCFQTPFHCEWRHSGPPKHWYPTT